MVSQEFLRVKRGGGKSYSKSKRVQKVQRVLSAFGRQVQRVVVSPLRAMSFISRLRRSRQHRVSILSAYLVHPFPLRGTSPRWEACHWIRGSRGSPMNPVPLPPQGETRRMERKNRESYISCTIPQFPPLVVNAVSQSAECVSCHMTYKANPVTLTLCSSPHRAIPQPSA